MIVIGVIELALIAAVLVGLLMVVLSVARSASGSRRVEPGIGDVELDASDYDEIRRRVERRWRARMQFATHAVLFVFVNAALWLTRFPAAVVVTMLWTAGVAIHLLNLIVAEAREAAIAREIERERQRRVQPPRRARTIQLSDEGELLDIIEDEWEVEEKRKRR